jgi:hypothetical protein
VAQHWSVHGTLITVLIALVFGGSVMARTPGDRYGIQGIIAFSLVLAYGLTYMAGI